MLVDTDYHFTPAGTPPRLRRIPRGADTAGGAPERAPALEAQGADQVAVLVNALRARLDLWTVHPTLTYVAQAHVNWMVATASTGTPA